MPEMPSKSHRVAAFVFLPLLIFFLVTAYYISFQHVWPLSRDQWHIYAPLFEKGLWDAALQPMSGHRDIIPYLAFYLDMEFFDGLNHFLVATGALFNLLIILLLMRSLSVEPATMPFEKAAFLVFIITGLTWLLNIAQLGWGFMSTQYYFSIFACLLSIHSFYRYAHPVATATSLRWLLAALLSGILCTFSFGIGIIIWPILLYFSLAFRLSRLAWASVMTALFACLVVFFVLPGGNEVSDSILLQPAYTITFLTELAGGPVYYLVRSYHVADANAIKSLAIGISIIATLVATGLLVNYLVRGRNLSRFATLCCGLLMIGLGAPVLISLVRNPFFLDVWVDRYQIWAIFFWCGFLPLLYLELAPLCSDRVRRIFLLLLWSAPIFAFPSQLDMGARLSEYKTRVEESLLEFRVGIVSRSAAKDALHWNWEHELPFMLSVWPHIREQGKNIFHRHFDNYLGKPVTSATAPRKIAIQVQEITPITADDILDLDKYPGASTFDVFKLADPGAVHGYRLRAEVPQTLSWNYALAVDRSQQVIGLGIPIKHGLLPRSTFQYTGNNYNLYGVVRNTRDANPVTWYLFDEDSRAVFATDAMPLTVRGRAMPSPDN